MSTAKDKPDALLFADQDAWFGWLAANASNAPEAWIKIAKKDSGATSLSYGEAVETGLCFGWVDSQIRRLDDLYYLTRFSPRRPSGSWTKGNIEKAEFLIAAGRMQPSGMAAVEAAKQNGRWTA